MISVVIPTYRGLERLRRNLPTVRMALARVSEESEILVSDDASPDGSGALLAQEFPDVQVLRNSENVGFSRNVNRGLRAARGRLVLALNDDVSLDPDYLTVQLRHFQDPTVFAVMGAILAADDGRLIDAAKYPLVPGPGWLGGLRSTLNVEDATDPNLTLPTLFASGANALMDHEKLRTLNYFSEIYSPYYMEDVDLGVRAWRHGWRSVYEPRARCRHEVSSAISTFRRDEVRAVSRRNRWVFHGLHLPGTGLVAWLLVQLLATPIRAMRDLKGEKLFWAQVCSLQERVRELRRSTRYPRSLSQALKDIQAELSTRLLRRF